MTITRQLAGKMSLRQALSYTGISRSKWYHAPVNRQVCLDEEVLMQVRSIGHVRPTYGTRRMAAEVSRRLKKPVNRKQVH